MKLNMMVSKRAAHASSHKNSLLVMIFYLSVVSSVLPEEASEQETQTRSFSGCVCKRFFSRYLFCCNSVLHMRTAVRGGIG